MTKSTTLFGALASLVLACACVAAAKAEDVTSVTTAAAPAAQVPAPKTKPTPQSEAGEPRAATSASGLAPKRGKNAADRVDLDTTTVTGNRELPKVMYVVPWKRSDIGDLIGRPANSLLDEVLAPVDRSVFRRQVQYYQALTPDAPAHQGEK